MMNCRQASDMVTDFLDGALTGGQSLSFRFHVLMCRDCRKHIKKMRQLITALGNLPEDSNLAHKEEPC